MSTIMLAAACAPGTPRKQTKRIATTSPPRLATGSNELMDSRIQRIQVMSIASGRVEAGSSSRGASALKTNGTRLNRLIGISYQPMTSIA
jgi:hypothetical protein